MLRRATWGSNPGAGIGALVGGGMEAAKQYYATGHIEDWGRVAAAAGGGAVSGAITAAVPTVGVGAFVAVNGGASAANGLAQRLIASGGKDAGTLTDVVVDATVGVATAGIFRGAGALIKRAAGARAPAGQVKALDPEGAGGTLGELGRGAASRVTTLDASTIRFSQSSVNGVKEIADSMKTSGWVGAPIDVVAIQDRLITVDNTRLLAAHLTGTPVQAVIRDAGEALPAAMNGRFGAATTWGEAVMTRMAGQNAAYRAANPLGSFATGANP